MARQRENPGAREKLAPGAIVANAIALADAEGLDAVTIRRLAREHDVTPMALYWHFKDKSELHDGIVESLLARVRLLEPASGPWPGELRTVLAALVAALRPHPETAGLVPSRILSSEAGLMVAERTLAALAEAGLSAERRAEVGSYLLNATVMLVTTEPGRGYGPDSENRDDAIRLKVAALNGLPPRRFPYVVSSAGPLAACSSPDAYYRLGLDMMIAGVTAIANESARQ